MYYISKRIEIAYAHQLRLNYESKCQRLHGHNGIVTIYCCAEALDENGMVVDFSVVKNNIQEQLDHKNLNDILPFNPTAENIARWVTETVPCCYKAMVQETEGNVAMYVADDTEDIL